MIKMIHNQLLLDFKGKTWNNKNRFDIEKYLIQNRIEELKYENKFLPMALVCVFRPEEKKNQEILGIGASVPSDLITNQYGEFFARLFRAVAQGSNSLTAQDFTNTTRTFLFYSTSASYNTTFSRLMQIGQGSTAPARSDFNIETPFANGGPEDLRQGFANAGYSSVTFQTKESIAILATGAGTITEAVNFWVARDTVAVQRIMLMARDIISPGVSFIAAQNIFVEYTWQI